MGSERTGQIAAGAGANVQERDMAPQSRALVALQPAESQLRRRVPRSRLTNAMFLAHMVATRFRVPQTCEKRRAEPGEANARYRLATACAPARPGRLVVKEI